MGRRRRKGSDAAVADVLGSILLLSITVAVTGTLSILVSKSMNPTGRLYADVLVGIDEGAAGWGSGDEAIWLEHRGGTALEREMTALHVALNDVTTLYGSAEFDGNFTDGRLAVGERWSVTRAIGACDFVHIWVVASHDGGSTQLLTDRSQTPDASQCPGG